MSAAVSQGLGIKYAAPGIDKSGENEHRRRILPSGKPAENSEPVKPLLDEVQQHNIRACRLDQGKGLQPVR